jgi:hypothetical protein
MRAPTRRIEGKLGVKGSEREGKGKEKGRKREGEHKGFLPGSEPPAVTVAKIAWTNRGSRLARGWLKSCAGVAVV